MKANVIGQAQTKGISAKHRVKTGLNWLSIVLILTSTAAGLWGCEGYYSGYPGYGPYYGGGPYSGGPYYGGGYPGTAAVSIEVGDRPYYVRGPGYYVGRTYYVWRPGHWRVRNGQRVWIHGHYVVRGGY